MASVGLLVVLSKIRTIKGRQEDIVPTMVKIAELGHVT